jgi:hypothetical protein
MVQRDGCFFRQDNANKIIVDKVLENVIIKKFKNSSSGQGHLISHVVDGRFR